MNRQDGAQAGLRGTLEPPVASRAPATGRTLSFIEAMSAARRNVSLLTDLVVDTVVSCEAAPNGGWAIAVDVVEAPARLGDNDLLATFEVTMTNDGEVTGFRRTRRYHREDKEHAQS